VRACADAAARHLSSPQFIRAQSRVVDEDDKEVLQRGYAALAESAIVLLKSVNTKDVTPSGKSKSPGKSPAKLAAKAEASGESLLGALNGLLASGPFLRALTPLLDHKEGRVRRKALALVTERLQTASAEDDVEDVAETSAGIALIDELSTLIKSKNATTSQAALMALEAAAVRFSGAADAIKPLLAVVPAVIAQLNAPAVTLRASAALSLASLAKILGARMVSVINVAVPALLESTLASADALREEDDTVGELILVAHSCLAALRVFLKNVAGFVSPFLSDIIKVLLHPAMISPRGDDADARGDAHGLHELASEIRRELPVAVELRLVVRPLVESWDSCLEHDGDDGAASCSALLDVLAAAGDSDKATNTYRQQLFSVVLRALDIRRSAPVGASEESLDVVEGKAVDACVALALKCTESEFLPFFLQCVEWARARSGEADVTRTRLAALFRLAASLADELRAVFVPFFRHVLDLAAAALDVGADPSSGKKKRRSAGSEDLSANDIWRMRRWTLAALRRCFQYDNVGFLDSNRYNMLYPLVVEQLKAKPPPSDSDEDDYDSFAIEGSFGYEVVGACASLLASAPDDAHWKPLHRAILMCGRDDAARARVLVVKTMDLVVDKLQEEYLVLLPEAIPFLAELTEDIEPEIERMTRKLTKRLSELSGEDLKTLMTDGFTPKGKETTLDDEEEDEESD
jgi:U3 small nucleolar RNA-associated protein 10